MSPGLTGALVEASHFPYQVMPKLKGFQVAKNSVL